MKTFVTSVAAVLLGLGLATSVKAETFSIDLVDGDWFNPVPVSDITISNSGTSGGTSTARWGISTGNGQSGYDFVSRTTPFNVSSDGTPFALGTFTHQNFPITGTSLQSIDLVLTGEDTGVFGPVTTAPFHFSHNETSNIYSPPEDPGNNDLVTITNPVVNELFTYNGQNYYFNLLGFSTDGGVTITTSFSTVENQTNSAILYGKITEQPVVPEPASLMLLGVGATLFGAVRLRKNFYQV